MDPQNEKIILWLKKMILKICEHNSQKIKGFGVKVEIILRMTDKEFVETAKKIKLTF